MRAYRDNQAPRLQTLHERFHLKAFHGDAKFPLPRRIAFVVPHPNRRGFVTSACTSPHIVFEQGDPNLSTSMCRTEAMPERPSGSFQRFACAVCPLPELAERITSLDCRFTGIA